MCKKFKVTKYLTKNDVKTLVTILDLWNIDRGADGEENTFDLKEYGDFHLFANQYSLPIALSCQQKNRFWLGGNNFEKPKEISNKGKDVMKMIDAVLDVEDLLKDEDNPYLDLKCFFDMDTMEKDYNECNKPKDIYLNPNADATKALEYNVSLQYVTIVLDRFFNYVKNKEKELGINIFADNFNFSDWVDYCANVAWSFHCKYITTRFETSLFDYIYHFVMNILPACYLFNWENPNKDYTDIITTYFTEQPEYWN